MVLVWINNNNNIKKDHPNDQSHPNYNDLKQ